MGIFIDQARQTYTTKQTKTTVISDFLYCNGICYVTTGITSLKFHNAYIGDAFKFLLSITTGGLQFAFLRFQRGGYLQVTISAALEEAIKSIHGLEYLKFVVGFFL